MRSAHKRKNPTISNVKSLDLWSTWRILTRTILLSTPPPILSICFFQTLLFLVHSIRCHYTASPKTVPPLADDPAGIPPTPALFQVSFPCQLCRPANSALHSPPSMTRSFRHRQINFLFCVFIFCVRRECANFQKLWRSSLHLLADVL